MTADFPPVLLLVAAGLVGLVLIPLGLPGLWVILLGIIGYGWLTDFRTLSAGFLILATVLALLGEVLESWVGFRFARRYGGSSAGYRYDGEFPVAGAAELNPIFRIRPTNCGVARTPSSLGSTRRNVIW